MYAPLNTVAHTTSRQPNRQATAQRASRAGRPGQTPRDSAPPPPTALDGALPGGRANPTRQLYANDAKICVHTRILGTKNDAKIIKDGFQISVIPHTLKLTNLIKLKEKDLVNVEFDILTKYMLIINFNFSLTYCQLSKLFR